MNILYFNYLFEQPIGGGTHAREVLVAGKELPGVCMDSYPAAQPVGPIERDVFESVPSVWRRWLRFWFKPLRKELDAFSLKLEKEYDVILFRPNDRLRLVKLIKKKHPNIPLCVEINALIHAEGMKGVWFRNFWLWLEVRAICRADGVLVVSEYLKNELVRLGVKSQKILVNANGVNLAHFSNTEEMRRCARKIACIPEKAFVIGYVGGMEKFRKLPFMLKQIIEMMGERSNLYFVMAGGGDDRREIDQILASVSEEIRDRIRFIGVLSYEEVPELMSTFDCAVFPYSNPYGSPLKLFEYMAMGIPVIGPDVPVVRETFTHGVDILLTEQSGENFCALVNEVLNNPEYANSLSNHALEKVRAEFTWKRNAERMYEFFLSSLSPDSLSGSK